MTNRMITPQHLSAFHKHLLQEEKSNATIEKYLRDVRAFIAFAKGQAVTKDLAMAYKKSLESQKYAIRSINSMLASLNSIFTFLGWLDCKLKSLRFQKQTYCTEGMELSKAEYMRLLKASSKQIQLNLLMQTICSTGIRISELQHFTVEAVRQGTVSVHCKNKTRTILIPGKLKKLLLNYARNNGISTGVIFVSRNGKPLDRSNIWSQMKRLCKAAGVNPRKVFPHNLRKLFARTFYSIEKDIAKLADILGHGNIETTRIYIMTTGAEHLRKIEQLGLVV